MYICSFYTLYKPVLRLLLAFFGFLSCFLLLLLDFSPAFTLTCHAWCMQDDESTRPEADLNTSSPRNLAVATNIRGLNYDLTRDRPCVSARVSMHLSRKAPERTIDLQVRGDKPCVSLPLHM